MDDFSLTKDADKMLRALYKEYQKRRNEGMSNLEAKLFCSSSDIHTEILPEWSFSDVDETCGELSSAGLLNCLYGDDVVQMAVLTDDAIAYMENRYKNILLSLAGNLKDLLSFLPWSFGG